jgi:hypothetical protein
LSNKTGSGLDHTRRSYGHKESTSIQCAIDSIQFKRHFAEPADVRANLAAAFTPGDFGWRLVEIRVVKRRAAASVAAALEKLSVHVNNFPRTCLLVEAVHVLGTDEKALLQGVFKFRKGEVRWIRSG